ncbi:hypothetical protein ACCT20_36590, partial [Rhizobium ruizarguesonis]
MYYGIRVDQSGTSGTADHHLCDGSEYSDPVVNSLVNQPIAVVIRHLSACGWTQVYNFPADAS